MQQFSYLNKFKDLKACDYYIDLLFAQKWIFIDLCYLFEREALVVNETWLLNYVNADYRVAIFNLLKRNN